MIGHIGLTPQNAAQLGGLKVQGGDAVGGKRLLEDAWPSRRPGPSPSSSSASRARSPGSSPPAPSRSHHQLRGRACTATARAWCSADMLGLFEQFTPRFAKRYVDLAGQISGAFKSYCEEVVAGELPRRQAQLWNQCCRARKARGPGLTSESGSPCLGVGLPYGARHGVCVERNTKTGPGNVVEVIREPLPRRAARRQTPAAQASRSPPMPGRSRMPSSRATSAAWPAGCAGVSGWRADARVGIAMENCAEYLQVLYGIWRAGMVAVPMNVKAAREGDRVHSRECRLRGLLLYARCGGQARAARHLQVEATRHSSRRGRGTMPHCSHRTRSPRRSARPGTKPGCSTPAGPPAVPRGPRSPSATCSSCRTATTPTSIILTIAT